MTISIFSILATLPSGKIGSPLSPDELTAYLARHCVEGEVERNRRHAERDEFYRDGGIQYMRRVCDDVFADATVRELRKKWIPYARFNNALKRIVNELSTVYSEPARRIVAMASNEKYQELLDQVRMDERMVEVGRLLNLHRALLIGFRVRETRPRTDAKGNPLMADDGSILFEREPTIDIATPASVRAVLHPNDSTLVVAWLVRCSYRTARPGLESPAWTLWSDHESVQLTENFRVIGETYATHSFGVCPWVPVTLGPPAPGFWPGCEGEDLVAAHVAIWFENILTLKESKSATKQTTITGDGTTTARGQAADSEVPSELPEGTTTNTVDMSMDLDLFKSTTDHILRNVAQNYGISPALIEHQGVQSAEARELMRLPLRELRRQQQVPLRRFERDFARVMAAVCKVDLSEFSFDVSEWRIEFAESETPLDPSAEQTLFEKRRASGLDSTVEFLVRKTPGLTRESAMEIIERNIADEVIRNVKMRPLMQISGSMGASTPDKPDPADEETPANDATDGEDPAEPGDQTDLVDE